MTVIWTFALASACAAFKPPNPAPTITTRGLVWLVIWSAVLFGFLLFKPYIYKIHRDGRWFQKFFAAGN